MVEFMHLSFDIRTRFVGANCNLWLSEIGTLS